MKKLLISCLFAAVSLFTTFAQADEPFMAARPVYCAPIDKVFEGLKEFEEIPVAMGTVANGDKEMTVIILANFQKKTISVIEVFPSVDGKISIACLVSTAEGLKLNDKILSIKLPPVAPKPIGPSA